MTSAPRAIRVRGARTHNLRAVDVDIPIGRFIVVAGPSGSGKSSLAFDTIHAESMRRLEAIREGFESPATTARPDVDSIDGLGVTIGSSQRAVSRTVRSTVASMAGVAEPIRRLFANRARAVCAHCGGLSVVHDVRAAADAILARFEGARVIAYAPIARDERLDDASASIASLARAGLARARIDGVVVELGDAPKLDPKKPHTLDAIADRFVVRASESDRIREAVELAYRTSGGTALIETAEGQSATYSRDPRCERCGREVPRLSSSAFRRIDAASACLGCGGAGLVSEAASKSKRRGSRAEEDELAVAGERVCRDCDGLGVQRVALDARAYDVGFREAHSVSVTSLAARLSAHRGDPLVESIALALAFLEDVGLGHLSLGRRANTLSSGEAARIRLASPFANALVDVVYVLDEPTAGLHARERPAIVDAMRGLVERGNTVICVEHDAGVLASADHVVEMGPGRGPSGGTIVHQGPASSFPVASLVRRIVEFEGHGPTRARGPAPFGTLDLAGVRPFGDARVAFPVGRVACVAGPSGAGKTTLLEVLASSLPLEPEAADRSRRVTGFESIRRVVRFDDTSSVPGPRSIVATRLGIFTTLRETFAMLPEARARGFDAARFGLSAKGGRCEVCEGRGVVAVVTSGRAAFETTCDRCGGTRFDDSITAVRYRGASLVDVLAESLVDARNRFEAIPAIERPLSRAIALGLGYLTLGRATSAVSGGEGTRLRLATELARTSSEGTLYLLDEPCRGLAPVDIAPLFDALLELSSAGGTVVLVEHAVAAIALAEYVVDLERTADRPSFVAAAGTPLEIARGNSPTATYLAAYLGL